MRWLAMTALAAGCSSSPCDDETVLPPSGGVRHGVFLVGSPEIDIAASSGGVARESCDGSVKLLGPDLTTAHSLEAPYVYEDEQGVVGVATDAAGTAVVGYSGMYVADVDEKVERRVAMYDAGRTHLWTRTFSNGLTDDVTVALGPEQAYISVREKRIEAVARATGEPAWTRSLGTAIEVNAAADPAGGLVVAGSFTGELDTGGPVLSAGSGVGGFLVSYAPDGTVRFALTSDAIGIERLSRVAIAADGTIAVLGRESALMAPGQSVALLAADRSVRWSHDFGGASSHRVSSMLTDGTRVVLAGDYGDELPLVPDRVAVDVDGFIVSVVETGAETAHVAAGPSTQRAYVDALVGDSIFAHVVAFDEASSGSAFEIGGAPVPGAGVAIVELAR